MIDTLNAVKFAVCATNFIQNYFYVNWKFGIKFVRGTIFTTLCIFLYLVQNLTVNLSMSVVTHHKVKRVINYYVYIWILILNPIC